MGIANSPDITDYGTSCKAWDEAVCQNASISIVDRGRWCCTSWCFAPASCLAPPKKSTPWLSNVHYRGMVRSLDSCQQEQQSWPNNMPHAACQWSSTSSFNEMGVDVVLDSMYVPSYWLTPGNFGPDQAEDVLLPVMYVVIVVVAIFRASTAISSRSFKQCC